MVQSYGPPYLVRGYGGGGGLTAWPRRRRVLAIPPQYTVDLTATNMVQTVNWDR